MQSQPRKPSHESSSKSATVDCIGWAHVVVASGDDRCDPMPYLRVKKMRKYMGKQDDLAVVAACRAMQVAALEDDIAPDRIGLYAAVGYIPFEEHDLNRLADAAELDGKFSMQRLSTTGFHAVNGLMTFRCLPNMPAFHISINLQIHGPSVVTYPGTGQFYVVLQQACDALEDGDIEIAVVMGVADQRNFLVRNHFERMPHPAGDDVVDAAGCLILQRVKQATPTDRKRMTIGELMIDYEPFDPFVRPLPPSEKITCSGSTLDDAGQWMGAAALPVHLSKAMLRHDGQGSVDFRHHVTTGDGITASSRWELW